uniref:Pleckstrin homology domain containing N1 n=1 Tax=Pelusios castaneus TaxID=367368 RepID=A0A8C8VNK2_9SAUR
SPWIVRGQGLAAVMKSQLPGWHGDLTTNKLLRNITNQENQKENLDQRFPNLFKKGRRKTVVRNLGKIIYYSKVKFKFQHCQEVHDCYLELFQSYLYFQSVGSNGLTYQGLLPLKELSVCETDNTKNAGQEEYTFRITGPLLNPLIVYCPSETELKRWLYHLDKQIHLNGGSLDGSFLAQLFPIASLDANSSSVLSKDQHDRLLILYPSTLVIVSEERSGLYFKVCRLINSIRVICPSYEDYQEWLYCLKTAQFRNADSSLSGSESFSGSNGRGSLTSDGQTNSWASGGKVTTSTHHSQNSGSLPDQQSFVLMPEGRVIEDPMSPGYTQPLNRWGLESQARTTASSLETPATPRSPLYADPYTPTPSAGRRIADSDFLEEVLCVDDPGAVQGKRSHVLGSTNRVWHHGSSEPNRALSSPLASSLSSPFPSPEPSFILTWPLDVASVSSPIILVPGQDSLWSSSSSFHC